MKKIRKIFMILILSIVFFKMVDSKNYTKVKPLIESLRIYNKKGTDTYYLVYNFNESISELKGSTVYLHGHPIKSEANLLSKPRQKYGFENWNFSLNKIENGVFIKTINTKVRKFNAINFGIYKLQDKTSLTTKDIRRASIKKVDLTKAAKIERVDLKNLKESELLYNKKDLKNFGYYKNLEGDPFKLIIIYISLLLMTGCIVKYGEKIIKDEYKCKKDIPKVLTLIIVLIYPIFIFIKTGAISTIIHILLGLLLIRFLFRENISKKNLKVYIVLILMLLWWYYATKTGLDPKAGIRGYKGIIIKYFSLPILLSLVKVDFEKMKQIGIIYLLSSVPYIIYFVDKLGLKRFGDIRVTQEGQRLAQVAAFIIIVNLVFLLNGNIKNKYKLILAITILSLIPFIIVSGVRGVWVGVFPIMTGLIVLKYRKTAILLLLLGTLFLQKTGIEDNYTIKRIKSITNIKTDKSNSQRIKMWNYSLRIIAENPLKGVGIAGYRKRTTLSKDLLEEESRLKDYLEKEIDENKKEQIKRDISDVRFVLKGTDHSHNSYLETAVATGLVGIFLYILLIILILKIFLQKFNNLNDKNEKLMFISFVLVFMCSAIYNLTDYGFTMQKPQQSIWFFIALLLNYLPLKNNEYIE